MDHDLDLHADGPALTAALVDIASVSGDEGPLADAIERALRRLPHLEVTRHGNTLVARTGLWNTGLGTRGSGTRGPGTRGARGHGAR